MPLCRKLAWNLLLERCIKCLAQNSNESLHSILWSEFSKENFASLRRGSIAVGNAVSDFNFGKIKYLLSVHTETNLPLSKHSINLPCGNTTSACTKERENEYSLWISTEKYQLARTRRVASKMKNEGHTYKAVWF